MTLFLLHDQSMSNFNQKYCAS